MKIPEIVSKLIGETKEKRYLQIGGLRRGVFAAVQGTCKVGVGVDLIPLNCSGEFIYHKTSSDDFFSCAKSSCTKYDVIFLDGLKKYQQTYRDIINALDILAQDGIIVVPNCNPRTEFMATPYDQYSKIDQKVKLANGLAYVGDVWKAIVELRSTRNDLLVITFNIEFGCACIKKGGPESMLDLSHEEIARLSYSEMILNKEYFLNLKPAKHIVNFLNKHKKSTSPEKHNLYVENESGYLPYCRKNYLLDEPTKVHSVKNGYIFPAIKTEGRISGGVCDENGIFVDGHRMNVLQPEVGADVSYSGTILKEIPHSAQTVVYGGYVGGNYGHIIAEYLSRMWWLAENPKSGYKYVFISTNSTISKILLDFVSILGLSEDEIIFLKEPMRFDCVIVPEQSVYLRSGYRDKASVLYNAMRDNVDPAAYEKVYFARPDAEEKKDIVGEEYFINYYRRLGYEIIRPEKLSIREQVAVMAGVKFFVCSGGTLHHQILFANNEVNVTVLGKTRNLPVVPHFWINQLRKARCTFIDVSANILPGFHFESCYLFLPTSYWKNYVFDQTGVKVAASDLVDKDALYEFMILWTKQLPKRNPTWLKKYGQFTAYDFFMRFHKYLIGTDLTALQKKDLENALIHKK